MHQFLLYTVERKAPNDLHVNVCLFLSSWVLRTVVFLSDSNCVKMLDLGVVPHILTLLEQHVDEGDVSVQHAGLSALRNLAIPGTGFHCLSNQKKQVQVHFIT